MFSGIGEDFSLILRFCDVSGDFDEENFCPIIKFCDKFCDIDEGLTIKFGDFWGAKRYPVRRFPFLSPKSFLLIYFAGSAQGVGPISCRKSAFHVAASRFPFDLNGSVNTYVEFSKSESSDCDAIFVEEIKHG